MKWGTVYISYLFDNLANWNLFRVAIKTAFIADTDLSFSAQSLSEETWGIPASCVCVLFPKYRPPRTDHRVINQASS